MKNICWPGQILNLPEGRRRGVAKQDVPAARRLPQPLADEAGRQRRLSDLHVHMGERAGHDEALGLESGQKTVLFPTRRSLYAKNDHFAKTGSGQT